MNLTVLKSVALLPVCAPVRRTALLAGCVSALFSGGLPFIGFEPGLIMGRVAHLPSLVAFLLHLGLAVIYGGIFSLVLFRSRDWWTLVAAGVVSLGLYAASTALLQDGTPALTRIEMDALLAHFIFGAAFTTAFKLAEIEIPTGSTPHA
jgi:hypothetical protein